MSTIHIQKKKNNPNKKKNGVHSLPCYIHADFDANVGSYFLQRSTNLQENKEKSEEDEKENKENDLLEASFRGRPLQGRKIEFPKGYVGLTLYEPIQPDTSEEERKFYIENDFSELTFWNWDKIPSDNDSLFMALQWIDIAEALHSPVVND